MPDDAALAAALFAVDPVGTRGIALRSPADAGRERWLSDLRGLLPPETPVRRIPPNVGDDRLLGGLDLAATLQSGRRMAQRGLLAEADGGIALLPMAERVGPATAARLAAALDAGEVVLERDGLAERRTARIGVVALDEGVDDGERLPRVLAERLAFHLELDSGAGSGGAGVSAADIEAARGALPAVEVGADVLDALCAAAAALGIASLRAPLLALSAARAAAALHGRASVSPEDAAVASRLVLAPRATVLPSPDPSAPDQGEARPEGAADQASSEETDGSGDLAEIVLAAARASLPPDLLARLQLAAGVSRARTAGPSGQRQAAAQRGRPVGVRAGDGRRGSRLDLLETLRAAAPRQRLRRKVQPGIRVEVRPEDFRIKRFEQRARTTTIFVVDASGSSALHRLAEAKGAVELCLAECYVRRDQVALIAFRGRGAELLLPPTSSLARVRRCLQELPGGGGTPLATGLRTAGDLADAVRRKGDTPALILLTDGRANVARDGEGGRARAEAEAIEAARALRMGQFSSLLVDTAPRPQALARQLADEMGAIYLPLPQADAAALSAAARLAAKGPA